MHSVYNIPGLGGFLGMQEAQQQNEAHQLRGMLGLGSLINQRMAAESDAQMAPLRMRLMEAQLHGAQQKVAQEDDARGLLGRLYGEFNASQTPKEYPSEDGVAQVRTQLPELDAQKRLFTGMLQNPLTAQMGMQGLTKLEAEQGRREQSEQTLMLRYQQLADQREKALRDAKNDADKILAQHNFQQGMLALRRESIETRRALASQGGRPPSGYQFKPDGTLEPIPGGPGDKTNDRVDSIRREFQALPEVKKFREVVPIIQSIKNAKDTPAGDLDFIYAVGKVLDPESVVREGEMNLVIKSGSALERFKGAVQGVMGNGRLTATTRANLQQMLNQRVAELKRGYDSAETLYRTTAERRGIPTNELFMDYGPTDLPAPASGGASGGWSIRKK